MAFACPAIAGWKTASVPVATQPGTDAVKAPGVPSTGSSKLKLTIGMALKGAAASIKPIAKDDTFILKSSDDEVSP
jgi:hypothetical protein